MFPTLSEAVRGERLTVAPPFFNKWMTPVGLILLFLTGVGPLLAWRKSSFDNMRHQFLFPVLGALLVGGGMRALGVPIWSAGLCFALATFVTVTITQEFIRGALVRRDATGTDLFTALVGLFARSRRRYAGYTVHLGIVLVFLGFAGNAFERQEIVSLLPGQQVELAPFLVKYQSLSITDDGRKQMVTALLEVEKNGESVGGLYPARWYFRGRENEPTTEVALRRGVAEDLHLVLQEFRPEDQLAAIQITINPLINWIWFGVGIMVFGTMIALLPERALSFATSKVPESAVTTSLILVLLFSGGVGALRAQGHVEPPDTVVIPARSPLEKKMGNHIVCMCGTCGRKRIGECICPDAVAMRAELAGLIDKGMGEDEIIDYFVTKWGSQEVLASPIDEGFNRLAWLLPYAVGFAGILVVGGMAVRWSRRDTDAGSLEAAVAAGPELESRLDDELRDLD
jgi:cytochrome c-type biogenesis protein CcmF